MRGCLALGFPVVSPGLWLALTGAHSRHSLRATNREDITFFVYHVWLFVISLTAVSLDHTYVFPATQLTRVHSDLERVYS